MNQTQSSKTVIDSHVHIANVSEADRLVRSASHSGIGLLLVSCLGIGGYMSYPTVEEMAFANNCVLEAMERFPEKILGICYVTPQYPEESLAELDRCIASGGMSGIKLWVAAKASDSSVEPIARRAIELDAPILQHAWNKATGNMEGESTRRTWLGGPWTPITSARGAYGRGTSTLR